MGYGTNGLTFNTLRGANAARLPEFKNSKGEAAHSKPDGSDWSPAQWFEATIGELGEAAAERIHYEDGAITRVEHELKQTAEVADVVTYWDIYSRRALDELELYRNGERTQQGCPFDFSAAQVLMRVMAGLGTYANARKKFQRGDYSEAEFLSVRDSALASAVFWLKELAEVHFPKNHPGDMVAQPHSTGINLGEAVIDKFNKVSERVGSNVRVDAEDWHRVSTRAERTRKDD